MQSPYLIIVAGPTGSGKQSLPQKVIDKLKLSSEYKAILIDDIVVHNPYYKREISKIINSINNNDFDNEFIEKCNKIYYKARRLTNCKTGNNNNVSPNNTCDNVLERTLDNYIATGSNIVFETTGIDWPKWLLNKENIAAHNYNIIIAWSVVNFEELINRNKKRFKAKLSDFKKNNTIDAPRLPDIRRDVYQEKLNDIIQTFINNNHPQKLCDENKCIRLLIFDNNTYDIKLLYDSKNNKIKDGTKAIKQYYKTQRKNKGGSRRTKKKNF